MTTPSMPDLTGRIIDYDSFDSAFQVVGGRLHREHVAHDSAWLHFKIRVRDAILDGINAALTIAGSVMDFEARLEFRGVPTLADVDRAENDLETGQRSLAEMIRMAF